MEKRPFGIFPHGKKLSLEKGLFPLEVQVDCNEQCPAAKEGVAPAIAGDLLMKLGFSRPIYRRK